MSRPRYTCRWVASASFWLQLPQRDVPAMKPNAAVAVTQANVPPVQLERLMHTHAAGMFKDVELAKELHNQFVVSKHVAAHASSLSGVEMNVHVLTSSYWPTYTYMPAVLPPEVRKSTIQCWMRGCSRCVIHTIASLASLHCNR